MTKSARHSDAVWPNQVLIVVICRIGEVFVRVPALGRRFIEFGVGKQTQANDSCRIAVIRTDWNSRTTRAYLHSWVLCVVREWIRRTVVPAHIEQEAVPILVRSTRRMEARFVDESEPVPTPVAIDFLRWIVGDDLEYVDARHTSRVHPVPHPVVAAGPHQPHVAPLDLL